MEKVINADGSVTVTGSLGEFAMAPYEDVNLWDEKTKSEMDKSVKKYFDRTLQQINLS